MTREQWFALPWYECEVYLEGLRDEGILKGGGEHSQADPTPEPSGSKGSGEALNLASADLDTLASQTGVQVRRAG